MELLRRLVELWRLPNVLWTTESGSKFQSPRLTLRLLLVSTDASPSAAFLLVSGAAASLTLRSAYMVPRTGPDVTGTAHCSARLRSMPSSIGLSQLRAMSRFSSLTSPFSTMRANKATVKCFTRPSPEVTVQQVVDIRLLCVKSDFLAVPAVIIAPLDPLI
jgi:hypothetical protein